MSRLHETLNNKGYLCHHIVDHLKDGNFAVRFFLLSPKQQEWLETAVTTLSRSVLYAQLREYHGSNIEDLGVICFDSCLSLDPFDVRFNVEKEHGNKATWSAIQNKWISLREANGVSETDIDDLPKYTVANVWDGPNIYRTIYRNDKVFAKKWVGGEHEEFQGEIGREEPISEVTVYAEIGDEKFAEALQCNEWVRYT